MSEFWQLLFHSYISTVLSLWASFISTIKDLSNVLFWLFLCDTHIWILLLDITFEVMTWDAHTVEIVDTDLKHVSFLFVENRPSRFPSLQVRPIRSSQRGHSLSVSPCSREPWLHEGFAERAQPAVDRAEAQDVGWSDLLQACVLSHRTTAY